MKKQLHQRSRSEASLSDEWETPCELYFELCRKYEMNPLFDVAAKSTNTKCKYYLPKPFGLTSDWLAPRKKKVDVWINPPHTLTEEFVRMAYLQWIRFNINIMMIIPATALCSKYAMECIEGNAEYHPILRSKTRFLVRGKQADNTSRNGYFVVLWYKRKRK